MNPRKLALPALAAGLLALAACADLAALPGGNLINDAVDRNAGKVGDNLGNAVASGEFSKTSTYTMEQEYFLGKTVCASVLSRIGGEVLPPGHPASGYVRRVGTALAYAAAELRDEQSRPYPLKGFFFVPVTSKAVNAAGAPGGFVSVTTGVLKAAQSEDELAAVLAHEIAHVQLGHTMQPIEAARKQEQLTGTLLEGTDQVIHAFFGKVVDAGTDFVLDKGFGKKNELEADALAVQILASAGYEPTALAAFLGRLEGAASKGGFFSRHPPAAERVSALSKVEVVMPAVAPTPAALAARRRRFLAAQGTVG